MSALATLDDFSTFLGDANLDADRAQLMLDLAQGMCESIVSPIPDSALGIVLSAAARAYSNPQGVSSESVGPYNVQRPWAGVYLTKSERVALRRMSPGGGAFSINPMPTDAGSGRAWAQIPLDPNDLAVEPPYRGDFDWPTP